MRERPWWATRVQRTAADRRGRLLEIYAITASLCAQLLEVTWHLADSLSVCPPQPLGPRDGHIGRSPPSAVGYTTDSGSLNSASCRYRNPTAMRPARTMMMSLHYSLAVFERYPLTQVISCITHGGSRRDPVRAPPGPHCRPEIPPALRRPSPPLGILPAPGPCLRTGYRRLLRSQDFMR